MNRQEFLKRLEELLRDIPDNERREALQYYNDYFDDAGEENESRVIEELGSPEQVARTIKAGMEDGSGEYTENGYTDARFREHQDISPRNSTTSRKPEPEKPPKKPDFWKILSMILLCILLLPVIIPVGCVLLALILFLFFGAVGIVIGVAVLCVVLVVTGAVLLGCGIWRLFFTPAVGLCLGGAGCLLLALGILATLLVIAVGVKLIPWFIRTVVKLISLPLRKAGVIA